MQNSNKTLTLIATLMFGSSASAMTDNEVHKILDEVAAEYRANLPETVDSNKHFTVLAEIYSQKAFGIPLSNKHTKIGSQPPAQYLAAQQKEESLAYFCSQPALEPFREIGVSFEYNYSDSDRQYLYSIYLEPEECSEGKASSLKSKTHGKKLRRKTR